MSFKKGILVIFLQYMVVAFCKHHQHSLLTDKAALLAFRMAIKSDPNSVFSNWNEASDVCNFTKVKCDWWHHRVVTLMLGRTGICGRLSPSITNLTGVRNLFPSDNNLYGSIPPELASLRHVQRLWLDGNNLESGIPESLSLLSNLFAIRLGTNNLTGTIPASIFSNCTALKYVDLSENSLTAKIPAEIGIPPDIWFISLYTNYLAGNIPVTLSNLSNLYLSDVENNFLAGELPSKTVEKLQELGVLHLSLNNIVSHDSNTNLEPFFTSLTKCPSLTHLELTVMANHSKYCKPLKSHAIELVKQPFEWDSSHIGTDYSLTLLDLSRNNLVGGIPPTLGNLSQLFFLSLNNNQLSGAIPPEIGHYKYLNKLDLSYNRLTGRIPQEISGLGEIRIFLNLSHNFLQGNLPLEISKMESVQELDLSANNLSGNIFPQLSNCIAVTLINVSHNCLEGQLPKSLGVAKWVMNAGTGNTEIIDNMGNSTGNMLTGSIGYIAPGELIKLGLLCTQEALSTRPSTLDADDDLDRLKRYIDGGDKTATFASCLGMSSSTVISNSDLCYK
ncbi:hypothetical protein NE237_024830 [Protea cynaroides]|uniref:Leucine-rich repeat-containing N-terminal plant-type domain-containing protein n=1 Tax=Protea cynaroides TaxID=273540 RepID=A0A9Q0H1Y9_9MAGN|nr:hypothetical protein NE237_024830 [Protea cynaroides]